MSRNCQMHNFFSNQGTPEAENNSPYLDSPLRHLPNVWITPQVAGAVAQNLMRIGATVADSIAVFSMISLSGMNYQGSAQQNWLKI